MTLSAHALFAFGKSGPADLQLKGRTELDALAQQVVGNQSRIRAISVIGHTDRIGSGSYNQKLGLARANTVKAFLEQRKVTAPISTEGRGMPKPVQECKDVRPHTALMSCMQPNRRVEVFLHELAKP